MIVFDMIYYNWNSSHDKLSSWIIQCLKSLISLIISLYHATDHVCCARFLSDAWYHHAIVCDLPPMKYMQVPLCPDHDPQGYHELVVSLQSLMPAQRVIEWRPNRNTRRKKCFFLLFRLWKILETTTLTSCMAGRVLSLLLLLLLLLSVDLVPFTVVIITTIIYHHHKDDYHHCYHYHQHHHNDYHHILLSSVPTSL